MMHRGMYLHGIMICMLLLSGIQAEEASSVKTSPLEVSVENAVINLVLLERAQALREKGPITGQEYFLGLRDIVHEQFTAIKSIGMPAIDVLMRLLPNRSLTKYAASAAFEILVMEHIRKGQGGIIEVRIKNNICARLVVDMVKIDFKSGSEYSDLEISLLLLEFERLKKYVE